MGFEGWAGPGVVGRGPSTGQPHVTAPPPRPAPSRPQARLSTAPCRGRPLRVPLRGPAPGGSLRGDPRPARSTHRQRARLVAPISSHLPPLPSFQSQAEGAGEVKA